MQLGLLTAILPDDPIEKIIDDAAKIGYRCLEVACWPKGQAARRYAGVTHIDVDQLSDARIQELQTYCRQCGVQISALCYYPNPLSPDAEIQKESVAHIKKLIVAAKRLGVSRVNTFIGKDKTKTISENFVLFDAVWPEIIRFAEENQIYIGIENCPMYFTEDEWPGGNNLACTPEIWETMFAKLDSPYFGLNYDPSHLYLQQMDYVKPLYTFRDRIFHVHFKDIRIYRDKLDRCGIFAPPLSYFAPKIPGLGEIDWRAFLSALYDIGYDGPACVEIEDKAFEGSRDQVMKAIAYSYRYLSAFID